MSNANFITQFEYKLNNLTGNETQAELLSLRAAADKHPLLDADAVALLDSAITIDANALTNSSSIKDLVTVGNASAVLSPKHSMIMPKYVTLDHYVYLKYGGSVYGSNTTFFYTYLQTNFTHKPYGTATLEQAADNLEQEIMDTGVGHKGVLTHAICAGLSGVGDQTIRVYADDKVYTFISEVTPVGSKFCIGDFEQFAPNNASLAVSNLGNLDEGYGANTKLGMLTPAQSAAKGLPVGIPFTDRLRVTVQGSVNFNVGSTTNKCVAAWLNYIPEGVL